MTAAISARFRRTGPRDFERNTVIGYADHRQHGRLATNNSKALQTIWSQIYKNVQNCPIHKGNFRCLTKSKRLCSKLAFGPLPKIQTSALDPRRPVGRPITKQTQTLPNHIGKQYIFQNSYALSKSHGHRP